MPSASPGPAAAAGTLPTLDAGWITAAGATVLACAIGLAVVIFVFWKPEGTWLRAGVYGLTLLIVAFAIGLTTFEKTRAVPNDLSACYSTIDQLSAYIDAKLLFVGSAEEAKVLGTQMKEVVDNSRCKLPAS